MSFSMPLDFQCLDLSLSYLYFCNPAENGISKLKWCHWPLPPPITAPSAAVPSRHRLDLLPEWAYRTGLQPVRARHFPIIGNPYQESTLSRLS